MDKNQRILNDLQYIAQRLNNLNIKGADAGIMQEIFMGLQDIEQAIYQPEPPQEKAQEPPQEKAPEEKNGEPAEADA